MGINISFGDYDTVCYSNQHNIIELIKHSVGLSIEVNINADNIKSAEQKITEVAQQAASATQSVEASVAALEQRVTDLENGFAKQSERLSAVYNFTPDFDKSVTGVIIDNLRKGIIP